MNDVLTKEFYDGIEDTVNKISIQWILLKNNINANNFKDTLDQIYSMSIEPNIYQFSYRLSKFKILYRNVKSSLEYPDYAKPEDLIPKFGNLNRWNPKGKIYLYLSGVPSRKSKIIDAKNKFFVLF